MKAADLKKKYGDIPVFRSWDKVPTKYASRTFIQRSGVSVPKDAKPDAIKNSSGPMMKDVHYLLYDIEKYSGK